MIIAVINQKGGVAKTTTAHALTTGGDKTALAVDLDPQKNLTLLMRGNPGDRSVYDVLTGKHSGSRSIQHTTQGYILASNSRLAGIENELQAESRGGILRKKLKPLENRFANIIIDCPPALNLLSLSALIAADKVIIPVAPEILALQGFGDLIATINGARVYNPKLEIGGVAICMYDGRKRIHAEMVEVFRKTCRQSNIKVYDTIVHSAAAIEEAAGRRESIFTFAPRARGVRDYAELLKEIGVRK